MLQRSTEIPGLLDCCRGYVTSREELASGGGGGVRSIPLVKRQDGL